MLASGYYDNNGTHIVAVGNGVCGHCEHDVHQHYFLNSSEFAHCNKGNFFSKCRCTLLRNSKYEEPKYEEPEVFYEV